VKLSIFQGFIPWIIDASRNSKAWIMALMMTSKQQKDIAVISDTVSN
jgi:hypothetical protein